EGTEKRICLRPPAETVKKMRLVGGGVGATLGRDSAAKRANVLSALAISLAAGGAGAILCGLVRDGHQLARPTIAAMAGTVTVRTRKVSSKIPTPRTKPACTIMLMVANNSPNIDAAKMRPAAVFTPPVELTVRMTPI